MSNPFSQALGAALQVCIVSTAIKTDGFVGFACREAAEFDNDSGWRFFSGNEDELFNANSDNFVLFHLNEFTKLQPETAELLNIAAQQYGAWAWDDNSETYLPVEDWQAPESV